MGGTALAGFIVSSIKTVNMKNEKKTTGTKAKNSTTGTKQTSAAGTLIAATDTGAASKKSRVTAGRGLANEGTATSYDDQNRND